MIYFYLRHRGLENFEVVCSLDTWRNIPALPDMMHPLRRTFRLIRWTFPKGTQLTTSPHENKVKQLVSTPWYLAIRLVRPQAPKFPNSRKPRIFPGHPWDPEGKLDGGRKFLLPFSGHYRAFFCSTALVFWGMTFSRVLDIAEPSNMGAYPDFLDSLI